MEVLHLGLHLQQFARQLTQMSTGFNRTNQFHKTLVRGFDLKPFLVPT